MGNEDYRILFAGGGTGGHIYMALAIADFVLSGKPSTQVLFAGAGAGLESQIVPRSGYRLRTIDIGGLKNVGIKRALKTSFQMLPGMFKAHRIVGDFDPSVIVGVGGYASGLFMLAGKLDAISRSEHIEAKASSGLSASKYSLALFLHHSKCSLRFII